MYGWRTGLQWEFIMRLVNGVFSSFAAGLLTASRQSAGNNTRHFLRRLVIFMFGAVALLALSMFLPDSLGDPTRDFLCWSLVGAMAVMALFAVVKVLEGLLDC